jgi:ion channel-forming bestrophin family protein
MIVRSRPTIFSLFLITKGSVVTRIWPQILAATAFAAILTWIDHGHPHLVPGFTPTPFILIGLAISIFLGFRNSASYDRFWEGRRLWGQLLIDARTLSQQWINLPTTQEPAHRRQAVYMLIAYGQALRHHLRDSDPKEDLTPLLPTADLQTVLASGHRPNMILNLMHRDLGDAVRGGEISHQLALAFLERIASLAAVLAGCERIRLTPLPFAYTLLMHRTAYLYCFLLPFGLIDTVGLATPLVVAIVSYTFFGLDVLGEEIEEPFGTLVNDLPLTALCRMLEINLREALGEKDLPKMIEPVDYSLL